MLFYLLTILFFVLTTSSATNSAGNNEGENPKIEFQFLGPTWEKLSTEGGNLTLFSSTTGDDLSITCKASYPVTWNITGIISPADPVHILPTKRDLTSGEYEIEFHAFFLDGAKSPDAIASAIIACEKISNYQIRNSMSVFVRGKSSPLVQPLSNTVLNSYHIPCATSDPTTSTTLYLQDTNEAVKLVENLVYKPTEGFYSREMFDGTFICKQETFSVIILANNTLPKGIYFSPPDNLVRSFADEEVILECSSADKPVHLSVDNNDVTISFISNSDKRKLARLTVANTVELSKPVIQGKVSCFTEDKHLVKEWAYEFIEAPDLYLDNFEGEIDCLSSLTPKMVQSVRCKNTMECDFMSHCLRNVSLCNYKKQKQFYATTDTFCWVDHLEKGNPCASLPFSHLNGLAQCTVQGLTRKWEFFISLEYGRYSNWKDAPISELIRIEEISDVAPSKENSQFLCTSSSYLFSESLTFEVEYGNGSSNFIKGKPFPTKYVTNSTHRRIYELNYKSGMEIMLSPDIKAIHCLAPFWNSSDTLKATKTLTNRNSHALNLDAMNFGQIKEKFNLGESNRKLSCFAAGEKQPTYQWFYKIASDSFKEVSQVFPELTSRVGDQGEGLLEFSSVESKYAGDYQCIINGDETVLRKFTLDVSRIKN